MSIKSFIIGSLNVIGVGIALTLAVAQTRVYIDIDQAGGYLLPVALPQFLGEAEEPELSRQLREVLQQDLETSGLFRIIDPATYIDPVPQGLDELRYDNWTAVGALGVIVGRVRQEPEASKILVELVLHDVVQQQHRLVGKEYRASRSRYREIAHRFSDLVFQAFTGETGPFDTQVICVTPRPRGEQGPDGKPGKDIVLMDYDGHGVLPLITDGALNLSPTVSLDGTRLAYTSYRDGFPNIYWRHIVSGQEQRVTSGAGLALPGSWSRDGRYLVLSQTLDGNNDLFLYDTRREVMRRLTTYWGIDVSPSFAPDGKRLVFTSDRGGTPQLYVTDIEGSEPVRLTYEGQYNTSPVWSPRDDTIAFVGRSTTEALDIYTIRANGRGLQRLTDGNGQHEAPAWAPDGRFLMYISQHGDVWQRHLMRRDGQGKRSFPAHGPMCLAPQWIARLRTN